MTSLYWGSSVVPLVLVEVTPLVFPLQPGEEFLQNEPPTFSSFAVRNALQECMRPTNLALVLQQQQQQQQQAQEQSYSIVWKHHQNPSHSKLNQQLATGYLQVAGGSQQLVESLQNPSDGTSQATHQILPVCGLFPNDPTCLKPFPCLIQIYAQRTWSDDASIDHPFRPLMTAATLVRVLPCRAASIPSTSTHPTSELSFPSWLNREQRLFQLLGESTPDAVWPDEFCQEVLGNHASTTVRELTLRMQSQLDRTINIGTTKDAISLYHTSRKRQERIIQGASAFWKLQSKEGKTTPTQATNVASSKHESIASKDPFESASLIVHSPSHAEGKTSLVRAIAQKHLGCSQIHVVSGGPLLAKYGIHADTALESMIHGWLLHAAVQDEPVCIIIDKLETLLPAQLSNTSSAGDAAVPVWNAVASYLKTITSRMDRVREFPFPTKNKLYHPSGNGGQVLGVRFCLVGIVTCPDDGWRSSVGTATILDAMVGARYRLPSLTGPTRQAAFIHAFSRTKLELVDEAERALVVMATSAAWAKGGAFQSVANVLSQALRTTKETKVSLQQLESAFAKVKAQTTPFAEVQFQHSQGMQSDVFASVGGNEHAKQSLEDAMALDPRKRRMLARFGFSPPAGILLYGPPGCGKTLLAKALASLLRAPKGQSADSAVLGGTFISLGSSDLVQAEVGTSEKMLVSAFDFAEKNAPSVIFLDEFQALFTERSRGGSGRLASTLLQCMDRIQQWSKVQKNAMTDSESSKDIDGTSNRVVVLGATNTPWMVDSAFLRTGRFDRVVHVGLPTLSERASIVKVHASKMRLEEATTEEGLLNDLSLEIAKATQGFSGADLAALCRAAAVRALSEDGAGCVVSKHHFVTALEIDVHASSDDDLVERLENWRP